MSKLVEFLVVSLLWLLNHIHALLTWDLSAQPSPSLSLNIHSKPYTTQSDCNGTLIRCVVAHHHSTIMERNKNVIDTKTTFKKKWIGFFFSKFHQFKHLLLPTEIVYWRKRAKIRWIEYTKTTCTFAVVPFNEYKLNSLTYINTRTHFTAQPTWIIVSVQTALWTWNWTLFFHTVLEKNTSHGHWHVFLALGI